MRRPAIGVDPQVRLGWKAGALRRIINETLRFVITDKQRKILAKMLEMVDDLFETLEES